MCHIVLGTSATNNHLLYSNLSRVAKKKNSCKKSAELEIILKLLIKQEL